MRVRLQHSPNPDIQGGYWQRPLDDRRPHFVTVSSLAQASAVCRAYIERNGLGGGNWAGGQVFDDDLQIATVSYNGRVWDTNDIEISLVGDE